MPIEFCHFEIYYLNWYEKFTKPADPLVLFTHYCLIQNRFKCSFESEVIKFSSLKCLFIKIYLILFDLYQLTDQLPGNWNASNDYYDLHYKKHDMTYRLEVYLTNDILLIQLRVRLESFSCGLY